MSVVFATSALPGISFGSPPPISLRAYYDLLELNLGKKTKEQIASLRRIIDLKNILSFHTGMSFDPKGNYPESTLRMALSNAEYLPEYVLDYLDENTTEESLVTNFPKLYAEFFDREIAKGGMTAKFLKFERNMNLIEFGINAKKANMNIESYLQYEDITDPLVSHVIAQCKSTGPFIFPYEYKVLEEKILSSGADPMKQYNAVSSYRFNFYREIVEVKQGSFAMLQAYMMCLWILEEKAALNEEEGRKILTELVENEDE